MQILRLQEMPADTVIQEARETLQRGGLVVYPTETVYGIGVDATNKKAVEKLLAYKSRREGKPLSVAVANQPMAELYVELTQQAKKLYERFLPGPYTIVSKGKGMVAAGVESEFGTLGIRIPDHPLVLELVEQLGKPITATSANASGQKRPYAVQDIFDQISDKQKALIDLVIDDGTLPKNEPSIVIDTTLSTPLTVRGKWDEKSNQVFETHSDQETQNLAGKLMLKYWNQIRESGLLIGLNGELGTGKTVFTAGIARFLKISGPIASPTYTYMNEYDFERHTNRGKLHHLDVWKIDSPKTFARLKADQLLAPSTIVVVEWWQQVSQYWPKTQSPQLLIHFETTGDQSRKISVREKAS